MYCIKELNNGIKIVMEKLMNMQSISLGIIIENGSVRENIHNNGISHFIEHMLFRGTRNKSLKDIAEISDNIGGNLNAFTSRENTCFYVQLLKEHLDIAIDLLSDMLVNSSFNEDDINKEKKTIVEEINMYLDDPEDLVHELLNKTIYSNSPLSLSILGNSQSINNFDKNMLLEYYNKNYTGNKITISVVGDIKFDEVYRKLKYAFGEINASKNYNNTEVIKLDNFSFNNISSEEKEVEQFNLCMGFPGPSISSKKIYSYMILTNLLVNNDSSRLYQSIRNEGLAYSLYSSISSYKDIGDVSIYMGLNNDQVDKTLSILDKELKRLSSRGIEYEEIEKAKEHLKINYILENEDSLSRMFENAKSVSLFNKIEKQDEILRKIDKINQKDISDIIYNSFKRDKINISYVSEANKTLNLKNNIREKIFRI